jgi:hypothetical protein
VLTSHSQYHGLFTKYMYQCVIMLSLLDVHTDACITTVSLDTRIRRPKRVPANTAVEQRVAAVPIVAKKQSQAVARKTSYRQLYQIRRTNGDIISQVLTCCQLLIPPLLSCDGVLENMSLASRILEYRFRSPWPWPWTRTKLLGLGLGLDVIALKNLISSFFLIIDW